MRVEFFGVRGTFPIAPVHGTLYGGHTACAALTSARGDLVVVDAGSGLRVLGERLAKLGLRRPRRIHLFLTHFHLDHVIGLPFFAPLLDKRTEVRFYSALAPGELRRRLGRFMSPPYFPLDFEGTPAKRTFIRVGARPVRVGSLLVSACPLNHPQGCVAYRFEEGGRSIVFATDTEPYPEGVDARLAELALGADALVCDATFTPKEYEEGKKGWGHGTWREGVKLARAAGSGILLLSHLNPDHSDAKLFGLERCARKEFPRTACAAEGLILRLEK